MENFDIVYLKNLKQRRVITNEFYAGRVLEFAKRFAETDMKLEVVRVVERGGYGGTFLAKEAGSPVKLAVKVVIAEKCPRQEIEVWPGLKHQSILRLHDMRYVPRLDSQVFISEYYPHDLETYLKSDGFLKSKESPEAARHLLRDVLEGLFYLHGRQFSHLNLKPRNIMISKERRAAIANFSLLDSAAELQNEERVPRNYGPPEVYYRNERNMALHGASHDIWSFGILALNVFTQSYVQKKIPWDADWKRKVYPTLFKIVQKRKFSKYLKKAFPAAKIDKKDKKIKINLIKTCLRISAAERPWANVLLKHKYFMTEGGFVSANRETWIAKIKIKSDCWIEIINPPVSASNAAILLEERETIEEIDQVGDEKEPGNELDIFERDAKMDASHQRSRSSSVESMEFEIVGEQSPTDSEIHPSNNSLTRLLEHAVNHETRDLNRSLASGDEDHTEADDPVDKSSGDNLKPDCPYDESSVLSVLKVLQPTFYEVHGSSQKFKKWISYRNITKEKSSTVKKTPCKNQWHLSPLSESELDPNSTTRDSGSKKNCDHFDPDGSSESIPTSILGSDKDTDCREVTKAGSPEAARGSYFFKKPDREVPHEPGCSTYALDAFRSSLMDDKGAFKNRSREEAIFSNSSSTGSEIVLTENELPSCMNLPDDRTNSLQRRQSSSIFRVVETAIASAENALDIKPGSTFKAKVADGKANDENDFPVVASEIECDFKENKGNVLEKEPEENCEARKQVNENRKNSKDKLPIKKR